MSTVERLAAAISASAPVTLDMLGSVQELQIEADQLAVDPQASVVAAAFRERYRSGDWTESHRDAVLRFVDALRHQRRYLVLRETADALFAEPTMLGVIGQRLHDTLIPDPELIREAPLIAGLRLDIALEAVIRTPLTPYRILDVLTSSFDDYPADFDDPLARAIGIAADLWTSPPEQARFTDALQGLADRGSDDAAFESHVQRLRAALSAESKEQVLAGVGVALEGFRELAEGVEGRDDAWAFSCACNAVLAFEQADDSALQQAAHEARKIAFRRSLLAYGMHDRVHASAKYGAELAWVSLAWRLETASMELGHEEFLDTWEAINAIIEVFEADRQLTNLSTIGSLIRPRIINEIARRATMQRQLERAVTLDRKRAEPVLAPEIHELLELVTRARSAGREPSDDPEESSPDLPYLRAILGPDVGLLLELSPSDRSKLESTFRQIYVGGFVGERTTNDTVTAITARLMGELSLNEAFTGMVKSNFSLLVLQTVRFLMHVGDTRQKYTEPIGSGKRPLEQELQVHFHQFLSASELTGRVGMEHSNVAHGRADVIVTFDGAQRFVTETKREFKDATKSGLESSYLAQALEYQSTGAPFGQLLVLDLTDHSSGTPNIDDSIWVTHRKDETGCIVKSAVVAVVRGNRPSPSDMV
jgi:hypothetical protein